MSYQQAVELIESLGRHEDYLIAIARLEDLAKQFAAKAYRLEMYQAVLRERGAGHVDAIEN